MISADVAAQILRLYHAEKWKIGAIARHLRVHHGVVRRRLQQKGAAATTVPRPKQTDPFVPFLVDALARYPGIKASRLYAMVTRRYQQKSIVLTTNKPFREWNEVFPSAGCVVTLIDRLVHKAEIIELHGESYRVKEAKERNAAHQKQRAARQQGGK